VPFAPPRTPSIARSVATTALNVRLGLQPGEPTGGDVAWLSAWFGVLTHLDSHRVARQALVALGETPSRSQACKFAWQSWYATTCDATLARQANRLTPAWLRANVPIVGNQPPPGSILVSVHHAGQYLAFARFGDLLPSVGMIAEFDPTDSPSRERGRQLSALFQRAFGPRIYSPARALRAGLELLGSGGSLITLPDLSAAGIQVAVLHQPMTVGRGAVWLAQRTARPIVPFAIVHGGNRWQLWCGSPAPATSEGLATCLEACIRQARAGWLGWRDWLAAIRV